MTDGEWWIRASCAGGTVLIGATFFARQWWTHRNVATRGEIVVGLVFLGLFAIGVTTLMFVL